MCSFSRSLVLSFPCPLPLSLHRLDKLSIFLLFLYRSRDAAIYRFIHSTSRLRVHRRTVDPGPRLIHTFVVFHLSSLLSNYTPTSGAAFCLIEWGSAEATLGIPWKSRRVAFDGLYFSFRALAACTRGENSNPGLKIKEWRKSNVLRSVVSSSDGTK